MYGLYIHIPFCVSKCRYCDFYSQTAPDDAAIAAFLKGLALEFRRLPAGFAPSTIFIGGGTPTALSVRALGVLLEGLHAAVDLSVLGEFSCEANPGTLDREKLSVLQAGGVNRISLGVQSFNNSALRLLGRVHDGDAAYAAVKLVREAGFDNVNVDLIQSIPGMTLEQGLDDVRCAVALGVEHVSAYNLIYEPGTPLAEDLEMGRVEAPDEAFEADFYFAVQALLEASGYEHEEISNFNLPGRACLHNRLYWDGGEYFGVGPAAHSHWNGVRFGNVPDLQAWCARLAAGRRPFDEEERLSSDAKARERLVIGLRRIKGVDLEAFRRVTGFSVEALCGDALEHLLATGLLELEADRLRLARRALFVSNAVFSELI